MEKGHKYNLKGKKLFVGIANSQETVPSEFFWSFLMINKVCQVSIARATSPDSNIRNNLLLDWFLKSDCDYYIQMDIDQIYPKNYFEKMVPLVEEYKVIGALIYDRWAENSFMPLAFKEVEKDTLFPKILFNKDLMYGIKEVPYSHTNLFMSREVVERLPKPTFELHFTSDGLGKYRHTDFDVNDKIKNLGYKIYINFDVVIKHITEIGVDGEIYEKWSNSGGSYKLLQ